MTNRCIFVALLVLSLFACRREEAPPPQSASNPPATKTTVEEPRDLSGQKVDTTVTSPPVPVAGCEVKPAFAANEPIDFTMRLNEAPEKLVVSVRILQGEKEIDRVQQPAAGKQSVTLRLPKLKPGKYKLEGIWGGNRACEEEIEVRRGQ